MSKPFLTTLTIFTVCLAATVLAGIYYFRPKNAEDSLIRIPSKVSEYENPSYAKLLDNLDGFEKRVKSLEDEVALFRTLGLENKNYDKDIAEINDELARIKPLIENNTYKVIENKGDVNLYIMKEMDDRLVALENNLRKDIDANKEAINNNWILINKNINDISALESQDADLYKKLKDLEEKQELELQDFKNLFYLDQSRQDTNARNFITRDDYNNLLQQFEDFKRSKRFKAYVEPVYPNDITSVDEYTDRKNGLKREALYRLLTTLE